MPKQTALNSRYDHEATHRPVVFTVLARQGEYQKDWPHGEGVETLPSGESVAGKWEKGEIVEESQTAQAAADKAAEIALSAEAEHAKATQMVISPLLLHAPDSGIAG